MNQGLLGTLTVSLETGRTILIGNIVVIAGSSIARHPIHSTSPCRTAIGAIDSSGRIFVDPTERVCSA
jgi:hypothetical protein